MMLSWMLSATVFTLLAGIAAASGERALRAVGRAGRVPWLVALGAGVAWPVLVPLLRRVGSTEAAGVALESAATLPATYVFAGPVLDAMRWAEQLDLMIALLWGAASCVLVVRLARALHALHRAQRGGERQMLDDVPVVVTSALGPAVAGVGRPRIIIPQWLLGLEEPLRALVLRHEQEHCRAGDHRLVQGAALATALMPWNPAVWWIARRLRLALEIDCDARVLRHAPSADRYGKLLLLIAQRQSVTRLAPMLAASRSNLEGRIQAMRTTRSRHPALRFAAFGAITVGIAAAACSSPISDGPVAPEAKKSTGMVLDMAVTGENADSAQAHRSADSGSMDVIFTGRGVEGGVRANADQPYFEFQVEKRVLAREGNPAPSYPSMLESARIEGEVLAQFVVDTTGRAEMGTFTALKATNDFFTQSVKDVLPRMRFYAAEIGGRKVKQLVQMPFVYRVPK